MELLLKSIDQIFSELFSQICSKGILWNSAKFSSISYLSELCKSFSSVQRFFIVNPHIKKDIKWTNIHNHCYNAQMSSKKHSVWSSLVHKTPLQMRECSLFISKLFCTNIFSCSLTLNERILLTGSWVGWVKWPFCVIPSGDLNPGLQVSVYLNLTHALNHSATTADYHLPLRDTKMICLFYLLSMVQTFSASHGQIN